MENGDVVDNKRLSSILEAARIVQSRRDQRVVRRPSTAHRADGSSIPKHKIAGTKSQRELTEVDLHEAINASARGRGRVNNAIFEPPKRFLLGAKPTFQSRRNTQTRDFGRAVIYRMRRNLATRA